jgi:hypothetical protein
VMLLASLQPMSVRIGALRFDVPSSLRPATARRPDAGRCRAAPGPSRTSRA